MTKSGWPRDPSATACTLPPATEGRAKQDRRRLSERSPFAVRSSPKAWRKPALARPPVTQGVIFFPLDSNYGSQDGEEAIAGGSVSSTAPPRKAGGIKQSAATQATTLPRPVQAVRQGSGDISGRAWYDDTQSSAAQRSQIGFTLPKLSSLKAEGAIVEEEAVPDAATSRYARPNPRPRDFESVMFESSYMSWLEDSNSPDLAGTISDDLIDLTDAERNIWRGEVLDGALAEKRERLHHLAIRRRESAKAFSHLSRRKAKQHSQRQKDLEKVSRLEVLAQHAMPADRRAADEDGNRLRPVFTHGHKGLLILPDPPPPSRSAASLPPLPRSPTTAVEQPHFPEAAAGHGSPGGAHRPEEEPRLPVLARLKLKIDRRSRIRMMRSLQRRRRQQQRGALRFEESSILIEELESGPRKVGDMRQTDAQRQEASWAASFERLQEDNQIHHDDIGMALELAGFGAPRPEFVEEAYGKITKFVTMRQEEFLQFCKAYEECVQAAFTKAFARCDTDGSGYLEAWELADVFRSFGIEPFPHVLVEIMQEVDDDGHGSVNLQEFQRVSDILKERQGFSKLEYESFMDIFWRLDRESVGTIETKDLPTALGWLGHVLDKERIGKVLAEVDVNGSGILDNRDFLRCMQKVQQMELQVINDAMTNRETEQDGSSCFSGGKRELEFLFQVLGYTPDSEAIDDAARFANFSMDETDVDISQFCHMLAIFRSREGFGARDIAEIAEAFNHIDKERSGEINTVDVPRAMRWIGWPMDFESVQDLIARVNPEGSGKLDLQQLEKIIRLQHEQDLDRARRVFWGLADSEPTISTTQASAALHSMGLLSNHTQDAERQQVWPNQLSIHRFLYEVAVAKRSLRELQQARGGFSQQEIKELEDNFKAFDKNNSGDIGELELIRLIEAMFPEMAHDPLMRGTLVQLLKDIDADGSGTIDFQDYLRLIARLCEIQDQERHEREQEAIQQTRFSQEEVKQFRQLFLANEFTSRGVLPLHGAKTMIHSITPLGDALATQFVEIFRSITTPNRIGRQSDRPVDEMSFPEFLQLMRRLLDNDFASLKKKTVH